MLIPYLSVHMNTGFYLVFSTGLPIIWLMMFFVFDRLTYWRIRPGQMTVEHLIGGGAADLQCHRIALSETEFGFIPSNSGPQRRRPSGDNRDGDQELSFPTSSSSIARCKAVEKLIAVKPEHTA